MIRINLLPSKKAKRVTAREPGSKDIVIGLAALAGVAAVVFLAVDQPKRSKLSDLREANANLDTEILLSAERRGRLRELLPEHEWPQPLDSQP